jgi:bifunctional UDP-N-acetylglucosamine pyrophosphorylase / glucosamine-1-phosphate N-acetyltransferase
MKDLRSIILAAGKGVRMKSDTPKVLHKVCGQALIDYPLSIAKSLHSAKIFVVVGHQSEKIREHLSGEKVNLVLQKRLLGTADAVECTQPFFRSFSGDVLILCGDTPLLREQTVKALLERHKQRRAVCTFMTAIVPAPQGYGRIIRSPEGAVLAIREENDASDAEKEIGEINVGVYCFKSKFLFAILREVPINQKKQEFYLTDLIHLLAQRELRVETLKTDEANEGWGVNSRNDLATCGMLLQQRICADLMAQGVTVVDPRTTFIHPSVKIGPDTIIRPFTVIEENVQVGAHCVLGPFTRLRPGTRVADQVELGNFTEVSRSQLGRHTIMKHFSFLGDAIVGQNVNVGAGVVTANYDGTSKNQTRIGDKAFLGSDSIIVAPVKIGKGAMTGAGCVVTRGHHVPDGGIVVGVPAKLLKAKTKA